MASAVTRGDCLAVMASMPDGCVDLVVTDPPYGMAYRSNWRIARERFDAIENDAEFDPEWQLSWMRECHRLLRDGSHFYAFCSDHHLGDFRKTATMAGFNVKRTLIWHKGGGGMGDLKGDYAHETEFIVFGHKGQRNLAGSRMANVLRVPRIAPSDLRHPTEKPLGVLRPLIQKSSAPNDLVLDPFAGSGATAVCSREEGRRYLAIEQDERYIAVMEDRLAQGGLFDDLGDGQTTIETGV